MKIFRVVHFVWFSLTVTSITGYAEDSTMAFQKWQELQLTQTAVAETPNWELISTASSTPQDASSFQTEREGSRSTDGNDLEPFFHTKWQISFTVPVFNTRIYTVSCGAKAYVTNEPGLALVCTNEFGKETDIVYVTNEKKYRMLMDYDATDPVFEFTLQDGCCNGRGNVSITNSDSGQRNSYPLIVTKMEELYVPPMEPEPGEVPIDYYRNPNTGDVWGTHWAALLSIPGDGRLPNDMWRYGLRAIFLAKYACWDASVREWMPKNIADGVFYCTNPEDAKQMAVYLRELANKLDPPK